MPLLKSFDEFQSKGSDKTIKSSPKSKTNENIFKKEKARGKDVWKDAGGKHKIKWKGQDNKNFIIKIKNDTDILDNAHMLTKPSGENHIINFFNNQTGFTNMYRARLDDAFFRNKVIAYTVKRDKDDWNTSGNAKLQKIQFTIVPRPAGLDQSVKFVTAAQLGSSALLTTQQNLLKKIEDEDKPVIDPITQKCDDGFVWDDKQQNCIKKEEKVKLVGKCPGTKPTDVYFEYTSGENNQKYTIKEHEQGMYAGGFQTYRDEEPSDTGIIKDEGGAGKHQFTYTSDDSKKPGWLMDSKQDIEFWTRVYNEPAYLCELLLAFKKDYPSGKKKASIKDKMYYSSTNTKIYTADGKSFNMNFTGEEEEGAEDTTPKPKYDLAATE
jgi:hypothetical protein